MNTKSIQISVPKKTAKDTHKTRKPQSVSPTVITKNPFFENYSNFFSGMSHSVEKGTFSLKTVFLKPKTDGKSKAYPLIK